MELINIFIRFVNEILSYKVYNIELITWLLSFSAVIVIFKAIMIISNAQKTSNKKKGSNKE